MKRLFNYAYSTITLRCQGNRGIWEGGLALILRQAGHKLRTGPNDSLPWREGVRGRAIQGAEGGRWRLMQLRFSRLPLVELIAEIFQLLLKLFLSQGHGEIAPSSLEDTSYHVSGPSQAAGQGIVEVDCY